MEEFLNSEKFYKMAKEYNEKYNSISALNAKKLDSDKLVPILNNVCKLMFLLKKGFSKNKRFSEVIDKLSPIDDKVCEFEKKLDVHVPRDFSKEKGLYIHNKTFIFIIFDILRGLFEVLMNEKNDDIIDLFYSVFDLITLFYKVI